MKAPSVSNSQARAETIGCADFNGTKASKRQVNGMWV